MNISSAFCGSRGTSNLISRIGTIIGRFGITSGKFEKLLDNYSAITAKAGCTATLPITAVILKRHPELIRRYDQKGIEYAIHGYVHIDYQQLSAREQMEHYKKAVNTFADCGVPFTGFRAPYLRFNSGTPYALSSLNFPYNSSQSIYWNVMEKASYAKEAWGEYLRVLDFYQSHNSLDYLSLPRYSGDKRLIEIPVSIPDDEVMVERLGIIDDAGITGVWSAILQETYDRGELFTLQLHPERILICGNALSAVISQAKASQPKIWIATLSEIARWWKEKEAFSLDFKAEENGRYSVKAFCTEKATLLARNCKVSCETTEWKNGYQSINARDFIVESPKLPVIGIGLNSSREAVNFIRSEGYPVEASDQEERYSIYFNNLSYFQSADEKRIVENIECSDAPLIRFWRWPFQSRSALTITGDIDSITLFDFVLRLLEARQRRKQRKYRVEVASADASI